MAAQRTAGGHYRIALSDIEPFLTSSRAPRWFAPPPVGCRPLPLRCWEYLSDNGAIRDECKRCVVYRVRAAWCFEVLGLGQDKGHSRQFCRKQGSCGDCVYFRRVSGAPVTVLVSTADQGLVSRLSEQNHDDNLLVVFASSSYETSSVIGASRPSFVIVDEDLCNGAEPTLLTHLSQESRVPGLKIALCGRGAGPRKHSAATGRIFVRLEKPLEFTVIQALVDSIPVERHSADES